MTRLLTRNPQISVRLYKTVQRGTVDGKKGVSVRYHGKSEYIDLTNFLGDGSSVRTSKSVREPAGGFSITFADKMAGGAGALETVYGLVEPMDSVEIRMWGDGAVVGDYPIVMRGFVSEIGRGQGMSETGTPVRTVTVSGQDYGKIWQMFQVLYLAAYVQGKPLLTNFGLFELFGVGVVAAMKSSEFVQAMVDKVINPYLEKLQPGSGRMPDNIKVDALVKHGLVGMSFQQAQGSVWDILKFHGDVGTWNELYIEDRNDGVYAVYRPVPALKISGSDGAGRELIQDDAKMPPVVAVSASAIKQMPVSRSDAQVVNFFWVNNQTYDLIDDMQRKLMSIPSDDSSVSLAEYPNTAVKYYGVRPMYWSTQQADENLKNISPGQDTDGHEKRTPKLEGWLKNRRWIMSEMNKDNVVLERGSADIRGGAMRPDGKELVKAGDYAEFQFGMLKWLAYVFQVDHSWVWGSGYTSTLHFDRGEGFVARAVQEGSPALLERVGST